MSLVRARRTFLSLRSVTKGNAPGLAGEVHSHMTYRASAGGAVDHVVVLMLENRSFDHMLGLLYSDAGNTTPSGQRFDGLSGDETNPSTRQWRSA